MRHLDDHGQASGTLLLDIVVCGVMRNVAVEQPFAGPAGRPDHIVYHAVKLTGFMRLIFSLEGEALTIVRIEEVSKHYDD